MNFPYHFTKKTAISDNYHFKGMQINGNGDVRFFNIFHLGKECLAFTSYHDYDKGTAIPYDNNYIYICNYRENQLDWHADQ